jgi:chromosome segregation ATPase
MQVDDQARNVLYSAARQALGDEAAQILMASLPPYPAGELVTVDHLQTEMRTLRAELRGEMSELREELRGEMSELREELRGEMSQLRGEMSELRGEMGLFKGQVCAEISNLRTEIHSMLRAQTLALVGLIAALQGAFAAVIALG